MAYRDDPDLEFLGKLASGELNDLVYCLTHDKDGKSRLTEELTMSDRYKAHAPDHHQYWKLIAAEVQCFGANTFATLFRGGKGVLYREVLIDVCDKMKVNYSADASVEVIESNLLMKILREALDKMSPEELRELAQSLGIKDFTSATAPVLVGAFQTIFRAGGFRSYQLTLVVVNAVLKALIGRGLSLAGNRALTSAMSVLSGPVGWALNGAWTAFEIAGAAYRVTIPAVIQIAALRQKHLYGDLGEQVTSS